MHYEPRRAQRGLPELIIHSELCIMFDIATKNYYICGAKNCTVAVRYSTKYNYGY